MKKTILLTTMIFMLLLSVGMGSAISDIANLQASLVRYEPLPAQPGQYLSVFVKIENDNPYPAENAAIRVKEDFPFSVINKDDVQKQLSFFEGKESYVVEFKLKIDSKAGIGTNTLIVEYSSDWTKNTWKQTELDILIKPNDASLSITNVQTNPEAIIPGSKGTLDITLKNTAEITLRDIAMQIGLTANDGSDLPFIPTSVTEKRVSVINPEEIVTLSFPLQAYPSASPGFYKLPLTTTFYDEEGSKTTQEDIVGIIIKAEPELKIYVDKTTIPKGESGTFQFKFVNKGISDLKFLDIEVLQGEEYSILDSTQRYIGDLDSDDYRSETFTATFEGDSADIAIKVSYKDENNNAYEHVQEVHVNAAIKNNNSSGPSFLTILVILVVAFFGIRYYLKRKKECKHKTKK